jgi:hypothetical protein
MHLRTIANTLELLLVLSVVAAAQDSGPRRNWLLAMDVTYLHAGNTRVRGYNLADHGYANIDLGSSDAFGLALAIEYIWSSKLGALLGVRVIPAGRKTTATVTPAVAISFVH